MYMLYLDKYTCLARYIHIHMNIYVCLHRHTSLVEVGRTGQLDHSKGQARPSPPLVRLGSTGLSHLFLENDVPEALPHPQALLNPLLTAMNRISADSRSISDCPFPI